MQTVWNVETESWEEIELPEYDDLDYPYTFCPPPPVLTEEDWDAAFLEEDAIIALLEDDFYWEY